MSTQVMINGGSLVQVFFNLRPRAVNMLQAPRHLTPALAHCSVVKMSQNL